MKILIIYKIKIMKKIKWKVMLFAVWLLSTMMIISLSLRVVSKADTTLNLVGVLGLVLWVLFSIATNCLTFKNNKKDKQKN